MVGTNDLALATKFYDAALEPLNLIQVECLDIYTAYAPKDARDDIELYVTKPFDQETATVGNGSMIALKAPSMEALIQFHIIGQKMVEQMTAHRDHAKKEAILNMRMFATQTVTKFVHFMPKLKVNSLWMSNPVLSK